MLPLGIILTKRATEDRGLFGFGNFIEPLKKLFNIKDSEAIDYKFLQSFSNDKLFDIIKNYNTEGYQEDIRFEAISLLNLRGIKNDQLLDQGVFINEDYQKSKKQSTDYFDHAKFTIILYVIGAILLILFFVFRNNKLASLASASLQISLISFLLFIIYLVKSYIDLNRFYKILNKKEKSPHIILLIIGIPFYFLMFILLKRKIKDDLKQNCLDSIK
jgi:lipopolysaccharide export system permease protein